MPDQNNEPREDDLENAEDSLSNFGIADQSKENIAQLGKSLKGAGKNTLKTFGNLAKKTGTGAIKAADTLTKSPSQIKKFIAESSLPIGDDWQIYNKAKTQGFNKKKLEIDWKAYTRQKDGKDEVAFSMPRALFSDNAINKIDQYLAKIAFFIN